MVIKNFLIEQKAKDSQVDLKFDILDSQPNRQNKVETNTYLSTEREQQQDCCPSSPQGVYRADVRPF